MLDDAKCYSTHANKKNVDVDDVKLALQCKLDHAYTTPPPRDVSRWRRQTDQQNFFKSTSCEK